MTRIERLSPLLLLALALTAASLAACAHNPPAANGSALTSTASEQSAKPASNSAPAASSGQSASSASGNLATPRPGGDIDLLDAGATPRQALRYRFQPNRHSVLAMKMSMHMSMRMGEVAPPETHLPPTLMTMSVDTESISKDGDMTYTFRVLTAEMPAVEGVPQKLTESMAPVLQKLVGFHGRATITPRGQTKDASFDFPADAPPQAAKMAESLKQQLDQMAPPFPEEPVGVGAKWKQATAVKTGALALNQTAIYTLTALSAESCTLELKIDQTAGPQPLGDKRFPAGTATTLDALTGAAAGTIQVPFESLTPTLHLSSQMNMSMTVEAQGQKHAMTMNMGVEIDAQDGATAAK